MSKDKSGIIVGYLIADLVADTTALLPPDFKDWPSHMQDAVLKAAEDFCTAKKRSYEINFVRTSDDVGHPYVHIIMRSAVYYHEAHLLAQAKKEPPQKLILPNPQPGTVIH